MPTDPHAVYLAESTLLSYRDGATPDEADARNLITDLLHYMHTEEGKDIESELRMALNNFTDEVNIARFEVRRAV